MTHLLVKPDPPTTQAHDLLELFLAVKEVQNCVPRTRENYQKAVFAFLATPGLPADTHLWRSDHLVMFMAGLQRRGLSPSTQAWHQRHLYAFFGWLHRHGDLAVDIRREVPKVRVTVTRGRVITEEQFADLLKLANSRPRVEGSKGRHEPEHRLRNVALLHVLASTGIRRNELSQVTLADVDLRTGTMVVRHAKNKHERLVPFDTPTRQALLEYILRERGREPGALFLQHQQQPMSSNAMHLVLKTLGRRAGFSVSSHDFRRGFAVDMRRRGLDIAHVAKLLGHNTLTQSLLYSAAGEEEAAIAAYRRGRG